VLRYCKIFYPKREEGKAQISRYRTLQEEVSGYSSLFLYDKSDTLRRASCSFSKKVLRAGCDEESAVFHVGEELLEGLLTKAT